MIFFEARKKKDLYIWLSKSPDGPSVKFLAANGEVWTPLDSFLSLRSFACLLLES